jgi:phage terminase Nu1 subunit (DNA packaging protein)
VSAERKVEVTRHRLAAFFGVTPRWISRLTNEHGMPQLERGRYDLLAASKFYLKYLARVIAARDGGDGTVQRLRQQNRIRLAQVRTERIRRKREALETTLIEPGKMRELARDIEATLRAAIDQSLQEAAPKLARLSGPQLKAALKDACYDGLRRGSKAVEVVPEKTEEG